MSIDHDKEIQLLTEVVKQTVEQIKSLVEKDPSAVPPMTILVLKEMDESGSKGDEKTLHRVYAGLAIFDPDEKEDLITQILKENPLLSAYGMIMHANTYVLDKEAVMDIPREDHEKLKAAATKSDSLVGSVVERGGSKIVAFQSYSRRSDGSTKWEDRSDELHIQSPENSIKANPAYHRPFISEKDFE